MNLSTELEDKLDTPTKSFEVAFRTYVVYQLTQEYTTEQSLRDEIKQRCVDYKNSKAARSAKIANTLSAELSDRKWAQLWGSFQFILECHRQQKMPDNHDVPYLSAIIYLTYLFPDVFSNLISAFGGIEKYQPAADAFYECRNALSHRGSTILSEKDALTSIELIRGSIAVIADDFFWYCKAEKLLDEVAEFEEKINRYQSSIEEIKYENIELIPFPSDQIVCRENDISNLFANVCGWRDGKKLRNTKHLVCVSGYGGIGKTALVTDFISKLLDKLPNPEYKGLRPEVLLFYSAKETTMSFDEYSGQLQTTRYPGQFKSLEALKKLLFKDLQIEDFDDDWNYPGIIVIDNLETLAEEERKKTIDFILEEVPPSLHVIITTRIPEEADMQLQLRNFQGKDGLKFVKEYTKENNLVLQLKDSNIETLVAYSYGNSLVLVLAIKRLSSKKSSFDSIIAELKSMPQNNEDNAISSFMFQHTIEEILRKYASQEKIIRYILKALSLHGTGLTAEVLAMASGRPGYREDQIQDALDVLTHYLVCERAGDEYQINEFARYFVVASSENDLVTRSRLEDKINASINELKRDQRTLESYKNEYPQIKQLINEWCVNSDKDSLAIARAFALYDDVIPNSEVSADHAAYLLDMIDREFENIKTRIGVHPFVYYQHARILKELRRKKVIGNQYDKQIKENFTNCLMLLQQPQFITFKSTKSYPSVLWIYAQFLLSIGDYDLAVSHTETAINCYEKLKLTRLDDYLDCTAIYGLAAFGKYLKTKDRDYLRIAKDVLSRLEKNGRIKNGNAKLNVQNHVQELRKKLAMFK